MRVLTQVFLLLFFLGLGQRAFAEDGWIPLSILHTNDLHSHFRPGRDALGLGGVARLKTAIDRERAAHPNHLLVDGGDFSEGQIYYNLGAGRETLRMLDHLGYDAAALGNHDWLNGPDILMQSIQKSNARVRVISANLSTKNYEHKDLFKSLIPPYVIKKVAGVRIALVGLSTYEFIYDSFLAPVKIESPFGVTRELARKLKGKEADIVVVISHNDVKMNQAILEAAPDADLVIGAHDHVKLTRPVLTRRLNAPDSWVVEVGAWGEYLGRVDLRFDPKSGKTELADYHLTQINKTIPEDRETLARVEALETEIAKTYGPIFDDHVGHSDVEVTRAGSENLMGNLVTDAYRSYAGADIGVDQVALIYGAIHQGDLRSVDIFNANPAIYNPSTGKSWTLKILPTKGITLQWLLNMLYSIKGLSQAGIVSVSGLEMIYDPKVQRTNSVLPFENIAPAAIFSPYLNNPGDESVCSVCSILVDGSPLDLRKTYRLAAGGGVIDAFRFLNSILPGAIPLDGLQDTGIEDWRILKDYVSARSPLTTDVVHIEGRIRSKQPDLGLSYNDIESAQIRKTPAGVLTRMKAKIRNFGAASSINPGRQARIVTNRNGTDYSTDPDWVELAPARQLSSLASGDTQTLEWEITVPTNSELFPVTVWLEGLQGEVNGSNDQTTRYFVFGTDYFDLNSARR